MKYYLLSYVDEKAGAAVPKDEMDAWIRKIKAWTDAMQESGVLVRAQGLHPTSAAATVRVRNEKMITTHGPFAETKEQLGGFYLIDCKNLDEAIEWAAQAPGARFGSIEVRPVWEMDLPAAIEAARERGMLQTQ
ncbi:MAG TPA: YciI family protein [Rhodothermales bacterium]|nr:YciI family protein [Rhodothermales bacterium]